MATITLNPDNFEPTVLKDGIVLVDFWAPWCGPCRSFGPTFEKASEENADIVFAKIDTEKEQALASSLQIRSIPTLMAFRDGILLYRQPGALPATALNDLIRQVRDLDMAVVRAEVEKKSQAQVAQA